MAKSKRGVARPKGNLANAWQVFVHAEEILAQRTNSGLVAQSMLLVAFTTLISGNAQIAHIEFIKSLIAFLGIGYSVFQYQRTSLVSYRIEKMRARYIRPLSPEYAFYMDAIPEQRFKARIRTHHVPLVLGVVWFLLLILVWR